MLDWLRKAIGAARERPDADSPAGAPRAIRAPETADLAQGVALYQAGRHREALRHFEAAIAARPEAGENHYWAGLAARALGDGEDAIDHLYLAAHYTPAVGAVWQALGELLHEARRLEDAEEAYRKAVQYAPDSVDAQFGLARLLKASGRVEESLPYLERAVELRPGDAPLHATLALASLRAGRIETAALQCAHARSLDPACAEAWHHGAMIERERGAISLAASMFERALELRPDSHEVRSAYAHTLRDLGRAGEALAHYDAVLAAHPGFADSILNRSFLLLMMQRYGEGWDEYERRLSFADAAPLPTRLPAWSGDVGARVLVYKEQGLGDQIMFASCVPDLIERVAGVTIRCDVRLVPIFQRSFAAATVEAARDDAAEPADTQCAVAIPSLAKTFRRSEDAFPRRAYLRADPRQVALWRKRFQDAGAGISVGLAWRGGTLRTHGQLRSIAPAEFRAFSGLTGVRFVSLQYGDALAEVEALRLAGVQIERWPEIETDLDACASAIHALDLVISIDNTVAHLAGALGQQVWILLIADAEWRYGFRGESMPWYPRARLFRQREGEGWGGVLGAVAGELQALCPGAPPNKT